MEVLSSIALAERRTSTLVKNLSILRYARLPAVMIPSEYVDQSTQNCNHDVFGIYWTYEEMHWYFCKGTVAYRVYYNARSYTL
jgi:hypothetical protein